jgi:chromosome segregation ATPase
MFRGGSSTEIRELTDEIRELKRSIAELRVEREAREQELGLTKDVLSLRRQLEDLKIEKAKLVEDNARELREVRHMVGLEKRRQEFEVDAAKRETTIQVREENLAADRTRFEEQMKFTVDRFDKEVGYLKDILGDILLRLPTVTVDRVVNGNGHHDRDREAVA